MPKVPGRFDFTRYEDLRVLLPKPIQVYYQKNGEWDLIVKCKFYENSDVVWIRKGQWYYIKHKWGYGSRGREIVDTATSTVMPK